MSRISKYLKQRCSYEKLKLDNTGKILHDKFGEPQYEDPITIKCRKETSIREIQTSTGAVLKSASRYFADEKQSIKAGDKLDGLPVLQVQEYVNQFGSVEGFECYV